MNLLDLLSWVATEGFLLQSDAAFPSVAGMVTGESIKGSWWGHALGKEIFNLSNDLGDHPDVMIAKLISGKGTFVHRSHWGEVLAVGQEQSAWQLKNLSPVAKALLGRVQAEGELQPDALVEGRSSRAAAFGPFITELEKRLLVQSEQIHTPSGAHARIVYSWPRWAASRSWSAKAMPPEHARASLAAAVARLNERFHAKAAVPWAKG